MTSTMAVALSTNPSSLLHSSSSSATGAKIVLCALSYSATSVPRNAIFQPAKYNHQLGFTVFPQWNGLKHLGVSMSRYFVKTEKKVKVKAKGVYASLFGVGAPEALVIGVVALLVFGPKGLAEVARNLGKTLRAFQPTIRELQAISREFKSTLEREIGLDETDNQMPRPSTSNTTKPLTEDSTEDSGANVESNGVPSDSVEESKVDSSNITAEKLTGVLAQLRKEQAEEAERAQIQSESQTLNATQYGISDTTDVDFQRTSDAPQEEAERGRIQFESQALDATQYGSSDIADVDFQKTLDAPQEEASSETIPAQNPKAGDLQEVP
ncbi:sec-independent protein translocase protein TATB, chloroplastic-like [Primulina eburnea]|uniref:sec-independent protein translocase protein TATB, chloroplastic-like n=1 Tax=Primulina eburnea TaxID=1245227 RepID=UPI003C6C1D8E